MQADGFAWAAAGDPAVAYFADGWRQKELKWPLQSSDHRSRFEQPVGLLQHAFRVTTEPMQCDHQGSSLIHVVGRLKQIVTVESGQKASVERFHFVHFFIKCKDK